MKQLNRVGHHIFSGKVHDSLFVIHSRPVRMKGTKIFHVTNSEYPKKLKALRLFGSNVLRESCRVPYCVLKKCLIKSFGDSSLGHDEVVATQSSGQ